MGLSGRFSYNYDSRYFTEFNFGYNGSEKFAKNNRFGFFPSIGLGWILSNEEWFSQKLPDVNMFKLKLTHGLVGNDGISSADDRFFYLSEVNFKAQVMVLLGVLILIIFIKDMLLIRYSNQNVTWEVAEKTNYGLELGLFNSLNFQIDYFTEHRSKIYMSRDYIPSTMGLTTTISSNLGEVNSKGVDFSIGL